MVRLSLFFILLYSPLLANVETLISQIYSNETSTSTWIEGYHSNIKGLELNYINPRSNDHNGIIARAQKDVNLMSWKTAKLPNNYKHPTVTYFWSAGLGSGKGSKKFDLIISNQKILSFQTLSKKYWKVTGQQNSTLEFFATKSDKWNDLFGYMKLTIPTSLAQKNSGLELSIEGPREQSLIWVITYTLKDSISYFRQHEIKDFYHQLNKEKKQITIFSRSKNVGKEVVLKKNNKPISQTNFNAKGGVAVTILDFPSHRREELSITMDNKSVLSPNILNQYRLKVFIDVNLPPKKPVTLKQNGTITFEPIKESSGLTRSYFWPEIFWTHNDSGDKARIFPIRENGNIVQPKWLKKKYKGILIPDANNIDWEDIASDHKGNLIIGAFGNNSNSRRDLCIYILREPNPYETTQTRTLRKILFEYPDQIAFPPVERNFDAEALFTVKGKYYILTKNRGDKQTNLYRFDSLKSEEVNPLTFLDTFNIRGLVTSASASPDGKQLAVLTYNAIWLFESKDGSDRFFEGKVSWLPIDNKGYCEAICFYDRHLLISNEKRSVFKVPISDLVAIR